MSRIIKFRGKSVLNDEWIYGDLVHRIDSPKTISPVQIKGIGVKEETVGQFTGHRTEQNFFRYIRLTGDDTARSISGDMFFRK